MSGNREEIFYDRGSIGKTGSSLGRGAASVRIYTFNLATMQVQTTTWSLYQNQFLTDTGTPTANQFSFNVNLKQAVNPTDSWVTGGGWIVDSGNHANLAINAKSSSDGTTKGNMLYHYIENGYDWTIKTNTWTGFYIAPDNTYAVLQGKADIQKTDSTGQVVWSASNYQITLEVTDGASDEVHLRVLDDSAMLFHEAGVGSAGTLQGGQITIHS
jgi:hypothetical protein